jgi:hypothetical protein
MIWITRRHVMAGPSGLGLPMSSRKSIGVYTPIDSKVVRFSISSSWLMVSVFHKIFILSHRMFGHMHGALNADKKINCTVCMETAK